MFWLRSLVAGGVAMCGVVAGAWFSGTPLQERGAQERVTPIPSRVPQQSDAKQPVGPLMLAKLNHAQRVLEGLVTHDFERIASAAGAMKLMSLDPPDGWQRRENDDEVYEHFRMEFMRQSARLEKMAQDKNMEGAAWYQQNLTATCIACHDYIRDYAIE